MKMRIIWLILFGTAFGYIEAAVVVYLRELYYPGGFAFPIVAATNTIALVEVLREVATILLIIAVVRLINGTRLVKLAAFSISFAVWDITYYIFLKLILGWPESLFTWDILFLLPYPWVGPVWAPLVVSIGLIYGGVGLLQADSHHQNLGLSLKFWLFEFLMGLGIIISFLIPGRSVIQQTIPENYPWYLFWICFLGGLGAFIRLQLRAWKSAGNIPADQ